MLLQKRIEEKVVCQSTLFSAKCLLCLVSSSYFCRLYFWIVLKLEFYCQTLRNNCVVKTQTFRTFTLIYLTLLVYLYLWSESKFHSQKEKKLGWGPFKIRESEIARIVHTWQCCLWFCAQFSENLKSTSI